MTERRNGGTAERRNDGTEETQMAADTARMAAETSETQRSRGLMSRIPLYGELDLKQRPPGASF